MNRPFHFQALQVRSLDLKIRRDKKEIMYERKNGTFKMSDILTIVLQVKVSRRAFQQQVVEARGKFTLPDHLRFMHHRFNGTECISGGPIKQKVCQDPWWG